MCSILNINMEFQAGLFLLIGPCCSIALSGSSILSGRSGSHFARRVHCRTTMVIDVRAVAFLSRTPTWSNALRVFGESDPGRW